MLAMNHPIINQIEELSDIEKLQIIDIRPLAKLGVAPLILLD